MTKLLTVEQVSKRLSIARSTLYKLIADPKEGLSFIRIRGSIRFEPDAVERYIKSHTEQTRVMSQATSRAVPLKRKGMLWDL